MRAFRVLGIDVHIDYSWLLIFALILWSFTFGYFPARYPGHPLGGYLAVGLASTLLFFASVLFHELSHSLVARSHGVPVERITLFIFGGVSHLTRESPDPAVEVRIAAAGPVASFALGAAFLAISWLDPSPGGNLWAGMAVHLGGLNIALGVFNLLPGFPLDGGRVLRSILWGRSGDRTRATEVAAIWGRALGWALVALGGLAALAGGLLQGLWIAFIGLFLKVAADAERRQAVMGSALGGMTVADAMSSQPVAIPGRTSVDDALRDFFLGRGYGGFPVLEDDQVVGVVSLSDLDRCAPGDRATTPVSGIMIPLAPTQLTWPLEDLSAAMRKMAQAGLARLPVIDREGGSHLVGLLTRRTVMRLIRAREIAGRRRR